ncbi:MAG: phosphoenolpyruvate carboxykinase, partial [Thermoplasmatales archaeon]
KDLFRKILGKDYSREEYEIQFSIRAQKLIEKNKRIRDIYSSIKTTPQGVFKELDDETSRLTEAKKRFGDIISPFKF